MKSPWLAYSGTRLSQNYTEWLRHVSSITESVRDGALDAPCHTVDEKLWVSALTVNGELTRGNGPRGADSFIHKELVGDRALDTLYTHCRRRHALG